MDPPKQCWFYCSFWTFLLSFSFSHPRPKYVGAILQEIYSSRVIFFIDTFLLTIMISSQGQCQALLTCPWKRAVKNHYKVRWYIPPTCSLMPAKVGRGRLMFVNISTKTDVFYSFSNCVQRSLKYVTQIYKFIIIIILQQIIV